ncbi:leucine-rich repeat domain-containing protein [Candidatus Symbiothrix dinenymphae]|uniref:leucine-rich repeat domain-containing protein n=1 Tax=Candidatus Symbiothrix dinenymphae TaxID=467085 RepID=UPI0006C5A183|nr:leucine-rich repeat domain-containing protein [Candidatus Symbiothrix dinenymphae]GAP71437.1 hypothetical protein SAMD00024442_12_26 [Candidatus Symbiothrix dinenymphae]
MKTKKIYLSAIALFAFSTAFAETWNVGSETPADVTAKLSGGTLTISGSAAMDDYVGDKTPPWSASSAAIKKVVVKEGVISIGWGAFNDFSALTSVTIPGSVTNVGSWAFSGCNALTAINVAVANLQYRSVDGVLYNYFQDALLLYPVGKQDSLFSIPAGVVHIANDAFVGSKLVSVTIPDGVIGIGSATFSDCSGLRSVTIPGSVTDIGERAFFMCRGLTSVANRNPVPQTIAGNVFSGVSIGKLTLYVPAEAVEAYRAAEVWKDFGNIVAR